ncbi:MAG: glycosyltransferase [Proteobacteria bacterium]|nr:glycosyltransferase [Pseudomonadota bacterium]
MKKVAYFTNIAPHYRNRLWLAMANSTDLDFHFYFGSSGKDGIQEIDFLADDWRAHKHRLHRLKNIRLKRVLFWQCGLLPALNKNKYDAVIFLSDMHLLSTWVGSFFARFIKIPIIFWGHGIYRQEKGLKRYFRKLFLGLPRRHLLYGNFAKNIIQQMGIPADTLEVVYNSLDYDRHKALRHHVIDPTFYLKRQYFKDSSLPFLFFIGRLTPQKHLDWLIDAVISLNAFRPQVNLMVVGDGSERVYLEKKTDQHIDYIRFYGTCYDELEIGYLLANADLCVSPGNVGLTAIHSLSFGTPVCTHRDFTQQMPEVEVIIEGINGTFFNLEKRNISDVIRSWFLRDKDRAAVRDACYQVIDEYYNPYYQLNVIEKTVNQLLGEN